VYTNAYGNQQLVYQAGVFVSLQERLVTEEKSRHFGVLASDLWIDIGTTPANEGGIKFNNGKKPEKLIKRLIEMTTNEGDLVLDYHLGSGTTAAVAHKMNRRYIGIEQLDYGENDSTVRLKNVINAEQSGISKTVNWQGGGSYVFAELLQNNAVYLAKIKQANSTKKRVELLKKMIKNHHIHYGVSVDKLTQSSFKKLKAKEQKQLLIELLDKNNLYVNYSEIEDTDYKVTPLDKRHNKTFYTK
jgi:adenine-specific DNA-methyltransferase